jgi:Tfp pilus assembly PilM family ATPase
MLIKLSEDMQRAVEMKVRSKVDEMHVVDVNGAAEEIRRAFVERNIALEDIAASVAKFATQCGYPVEFAPQAPQRD